MQSDTYQISFQSRVVPHLLGVVGVAFLQGRCGEVKSQTLPVEILAQPLCRLRATVQGINGVGLHTKTLISKSGLVSATEAYDHICIGRK